MSELNIYQSQPYAMEPMLNVSVEWVTQISENRAGKENRTPKITEPQYSIEGSDFVLRDEDFAVFTQAFINAEGKNNAFPFKCPLDYYVTANGELYNDVFQQGLLVAIDSLNYQIVKQYSAGGVSTYKTILLPVDGTIHIYEDGIEVFPAVNLSTGVVTFANPPTGALKVECEFRLPMRFDVDDNQLNQIKRAVNSVYAANDTSIYLAVNFRLIEDMNYERKALLETWNINLNLNFDGHPLSDIAYSDRSLTRIQSSDNKRETRDGLNVFRKKYSIANNNMDWNAVQRYFTLFMACKGRLLPFTFEGSLVRLDSDVFSCSMIGYNNVVIAEFNTCRISAPYFASLSLPFETGDAPRKTTIASFDISDYQGSILPISNFVLDDFAFIVKSDFNVASAYSLVGSTRVITLPPETLIVVEGGNPNFANGGLNHTLQTNYIYNGQTYIVPAAPGGVPVTPLSEAIQGLIAIGCPYQPHDSISINQLASLGFVNNGIVSFKIMHVNHGGGNITLEINVPQC